MEQYFWLVEPNRPKPITFQVSHENTNNTRRENMKMADFVLLLLELFDDSEAEYGKINGDDEIHEEGGFFWRGEELAA